MVEKPIYKPERVSAAQARRLRQTPETSILKGVTTTATTMAIAIGISAIAGGLKQVAGKAILKGSLRGYHSKAAYEKIAAKPITEMLTSLEKAPKFTKFSAHFGAGMSEYQSMGMGLLKGITQDKKGKTATFFNNVLGGAKTWGNMVKEGVAHQQKAGIAGGGYYRTLFTGMQKGNAVFSATRGQRQAAFAYKFLVEPLKGLGSYYVSQLVTGQHKPTKEFKPYNVAGWAGDYLNWTTKNALGYVGYGAAMKLAWGLPSGVSAGVQGLFNKAPELQRAGRSVFDFLETTDRFTKGSFKSINSFLTNLGSVKKRFTHAKGVFNDYVYRDRRPDGVSATVRKYASERDVVSNMRTLDGRVEYLKDTKKMRRLSATENEEFRMLGRLKKYSQGKDYKQAIKDYTEKPEFLEYYGIGLESNRPKKTGLSAFVSSLTGGVDNRFLNETEKKLLSKSGMDTQLIDKMKVYGEVLLRHRDGSSFVGADYSRGFVSDTISKLNEFKFMGINLFKILPMDYLTYNEKKVPFGISKHVFHDRQGDGFDSISVQAKLGESLREFKVLNKQQIKNVMGTDKRITNEMITKFIEDNFSDKLHDIKVDLPKNTEYITMSGATKIPGDLFDKIFPNTLFVRSLNDFNISKAEKEALKPNHMRFLSREWATYHGFISDEPELNNMWSMIGRFIKGKHKIDYKKHPELMPLRDIVDPTIAKDFLGLHVQEKLDGKTAFGKMKANWTNFLYKTEDLLAKTGIFRKQQMSTINATMEDIQINPAMKQKLIDAAKKMGIKDKDIASFVNREINMFKGIMTGRVQEKEVLYHIYTNDYLKNTAKRFGSLNTKSYIGMMERDIGQDLTSLTPQSFQKLVQTGRYDVHRSTRFKNYHIIDEFKDFILDDTVTKLLDPDLNAVNRTEIQELMTKLGLKAFEPKVKERVTDLFMQSYARKQVYSSFEKLGLFNATDLMSKVVDGEKAAELFNRNKDVIGSLYGKLSLLRNEIGDPWLAGLDKKIHQGNFFFLKPDLGIAHPQGLPDFVYKNVEHNVKDSMAQHMYGTFGSGTLFLEKDTPGTVKTSHLTHKNLMSRAVFQRLNDVLSKVGLGVNPTGLYTPLEITKELLAKRVMPLSLMVGGASAVNALSAEIIDGGIFGAFAGTIAGFDLGMSKLRDSLGITKAAQDLEGLMPGSVDSTFGKAARIVLPTVGLLHAGAAGLSPWVTLPLMAANSILGVTADPTKTAEEMGEIYRGERLVPIRKGRFWELCVEGNTIVRTNNGIKKIKDIELGDIIITHKGNQAKIIDKSSRKDDTMITIEGSPFTMEQIKSTEEHPILVYSNDELMWKEAKDISIQDLLAYPIQKRDVTYLYQYKLAKNLGLILGCYLKNGNIIKDKNSKSTGLEFTFSLNDEKKAKEVYTTIQGVFKVKTTLVKDDDQKIIILRYSNDTLTRFFDNYFKGNEKIIPPCLYCVKSNAFYESLIYGLRDFNNNITKSNVYAYNNNTNIAHLFWMACLHLKKVIEKTVISDSVEYVLFKIKSIYKENVSNNFYDICVDHKDHSFLGLSVAYHNSSTPYEGTKVEAFSPNWYTRLKSDYKFTSDIYGSPLEAFVHKPMPMLGFSLGSVFDPYHYERKSAKRRPADYSTPLFNDIPLAGNLISSTLGELIKPSISLSPIDRYDHEGQVHEDPFGRVATQRTIQNSVIESPYNIQVDNANRGAAATHHPAPPINPHSAYPMLSDTIYKNVVEAPGIYGWGYEQLAGIPGVRTSPSGMINPKVGNSSRMSLGVGSGRRFSMAYNWWNENIGSGGLPGEALRRLFPRDPYEEIYAEGTHNPTMAAWLPYEFKLGDSFLRTKMGQIRLPGTGYLASHLSHRSFPISATMIGFDPQTVADYHSGNVDYTPLDLRNNENDKFIKAQTTMELSMIHKVLKTNALVYDPVNDIDGTIDAIINDGQGKLPVTIKRMSPKEYETISDKEPLDRHLAEIQFYMNHMNAKEGKIVYVNDQSPDLKKIMDVEFDPRLFDRAIETVRTAKNMWADSIRRGVGYAGAEISWLDRYQSLADVSPFSDEYKRAKSIVNMQERKGMLTPAQKKRIKHIEEIKQARSMGVETYERRFLIGQLLDPDKQLPITNTNKFMKAAAQYTLPERVIGSMWEYSSHANTWMNRKFMNKFSTKEYLNYKLAWGRESAFWNDPVDTFIKPSFTMGFGRSDDFLSTAISSVGQMAAFGSMFGGGPIMPILGAGQAAVGGMLPPPNKKEGRAILELSKADLLRDQSMFARTADHKYKERISSNIISLLNNQVAPDFRQVVRATPPKYKKIIGNILSLPPDQQLDMVQYLPGPLQHLIMKHNEQRVIPTHNNEFTGPSPDILEGTDQEYETYKIKYLMNEGLDYHDFGLGFRGQDDAAKGMSYRKAKEYKNEYRYDFGKEQTNVVKTAINNLLSQYGIEAAVIVRSTKSGTTIAIS